MRKVICSILAGVCLASTMVSAHQIVAIEDGEEYRAVFWNHDVYEAYDKSQLKNAEAYGLDGNAMNTGINYDSDVPALLTEGKVGMMTLAFDAGYWRKTIKGYQSVKEMKSEGILFGSLKSYKFGKTLFVWHSNFSKPTGMYLEIVPLQNPYTLKVGQTLPVLVLKEGKPLAGAGFEGNQIKEGALQTDTYGIAHVPLKEKGRFIIAAKFYAQQVTDPLANAITIQSSLAFEVN
jgi:nickel transport protein